MATKTKRLARFREPIRTAKLNRWYAAKLAKLARIVRLIVKLHEHETDPIAKAKAIESDLFGYAQTLDLWAHEVSATMLKRASQADLEVWMGLGEEISLDNRRRLKAVEGQIFKQLQDEQVTLIKSLPLEAAKKVHEMATEAMVSGERFDSLDDRIHALGDITKSRAICIARTETARARSNFTEARARSIGSTQYIWHTVGDKTVRACHARNDGKVFNWDDPPIADDRTKARANPGAIWNCRCYAEPLFSKSEYDE